MFFVVLSRVKDKVLLFARLVLVMCILCIIIAQLYGVFKANWIEHDKTTNEPLRVEWHLGWE
ncbi:hypothetical protein [Desulfoscipio gibsoniae]